MKKLEYERAVVAVVDAEEMDSLTALARSCPTLNNQPDRRQGPRFPHR